MIAQNDRLLSDYIHSLEDLTRVKPMAIMRWINSPEMQFEVLTKSKNPEFILRWIDNLSLTLFFIRSILLSWAYQPDTDPFEEPFLGYSVLEELKSPAASKLRQLAETIQKDPFEWSWRKYQLLKELYVSLWTRIDNHSIHQKNSSKTVIERLITSHYGNVAFLAANVYHFFQIHHHDNSEGYQKDFLHDILSILSNLSEIPNQVKSFIMRKLEKLGMTQSLPQQQMFNRDLFTSPLQHLLPSMKWENKVIVVGIRFNSLEVFLDIAVTELAIPNEIVINDKTTQHDHANFIPINGRETVLEIDQISWEELERFMKNKGYMNTPHPDSNDWKLIEQLTGWLIARCMIFLDSLINNRPLQLILALERSISTDFSPFRSPTHLNLEFLARIGHQVLGLVEELSSRWSPLVKVEHVDVEPQWDTCPLCHRPIDDAHLIQLQPEENVTLLATLSQGEDENIQVHVIKKLDKDQSQSNMQSKAALPTRDLTDTLEYLVGDLSGMMVLRIKAMNSSKQLLVGTSYLLKGINIKIIGKNGRIIELDENTDIIPLPHVLPHVNLNINLSDQ